jgi:hypothetical protein
MSTDLHKFLGQWVAIVDKKVVAHGPDARVVFERAKKDYPGRIPFLAAVPKSTTMIL